MSLKIPSEQYLRKMLASKILPPVLSKKKLNDLGIILTTKDRERLRLRLENLESDEPLLELSDEQILGSKLTLEEIEEKKIKLNLSDELEDIKHFADSIPNQYVEFILYAIDHLANGLLPKLKDNAPSMLQEKIETKTLFETDLKNIWGKALDLLYVAKVISMEAGSAFNDEFQANVGKKPDFVFETLIRLHARACHITSEIHILLSSGYADGAHARWRTLHEIAVVALFIKKSGQETAERYLLHDTIESLRAARLYKQYSDKLGYETLSSEEFRQIELSATNLKARFGENYGSQYGWAAEALGIKQPSIIDIEKAANLDHLRPYYKLASHNVHSNPKGLYFKLGLLPTDKNVLLIGPSKLGLADPGQGAAISLYQTSVALLTYSPNVDSLVACKILESLLQEICDEFIKAHQISSKDANTR